jgi:hypothetical protein
MTDATPPKSTVESRLVAADPRIFEFFHAWRSARRKSLVPLRTDFEPLEIPALLRYVWIYRFDPDLGDFVCKLAGEDINTAWGRSIKGMTLREIVGPADHPVMMGRWTQLLTVPLLHYGSATERLSEMETQVAERLLLPLASDDDTIDHVLGISLYTISGANRTRTPLVPADIVQIPCAEV